MMPSRQSRQQKSQVYAKYLPRPTCMPGWIWVPISRRSLVQRKNLFGFGAHFGLERRLIKQWAIQCLIVLNNRLVFGTHWCKKLLCSKVFGSEQHRDSPWSACNAPWFLYQWAVSFEQMVQFLILRIESSPLCYHRSKQEKQMFAKDALVKLFAKAWVRYQIRDVSFFGKVDAILKFRS